MEHSTFALAERIEEIQEQIQKDGKRKKSKNERRKKMIPFKYELGTVLKDIVTGFWGVAMGRTQYYTGCNHYGLVSRKLTKEGELGNWQWLDESRLNPAGEEKVIFEGAKPTSGPAPNPPEM